MKTRRVAVAYSGGRDSTALLRATIAVATRLDIEVVALHVHHGLSPQADAWLAHCADLCRRWSRAGKPVTFAASRLDGRPSRGESVEAWARQSRYRALRAMARDHDVDLVLLAHHRRDQAETFLLQALRGGGVAGLAAMPPLARRDGVSWARPWLEHPREAIEAYARAHRLRWIEDDSNDDERLGRNRLRRRVWPPLVSAFDDAEATLAAAARWAQHAAQALDEIAGADLERVSDGDALELVSWQSLPPARRRNALRAWLARKRSAPAAATLVERLLREADVAGARRWPAGSGELRSYRGRLTWHAPSPPLPSPVPAIVDLSRPGVHAFEAWQGAFHVELVAAGGIAVTDARCLELRVRRPQDRFQAGAARPPRSLKLQFQAAGVPACDRSGPIVCSDGRIVFVPGLGIDARALAAPDVAQVSIAWLSR